jgi:hypothetical protein
MVAVQLLIPFFKQVRDKTVGRITDDLSDAAAEKAGTIYEKIRNAVAGDPADEALVAGAKADPDDTDRREFLQRKLTRLLENDPELAAEIERLVGEAQPVGGVQISARDSGVVASRDVSLRGEYVAGRDLSVNAPPPPKGSP